VAMRTRHKNQLVDCLVLEILRYQNRNFVLKNYSYSFDSQSVEKQNIDKEKLDLPGLTHLILKFVVKLDLCYVFAL
jgi:hypothetical protein